MLNGYPRKRVADALPIAKLPDESQCRSVHKWVRMGAYWLPRRTQETGHQRPETAQCSPSERIRLRARRPIWSFIKTDRCRTAEHRERQVAYRMSVRLSKSKTTVLKAAAATSRPDAKRLFCCILDPDYPAAAEWNPNHARC